MDDRFHDILDTLPEKTPRSRLEPYGELIEKLRQRGRTYRDIAGILEEKCQLRVSVSTVHDFVRVRSRTEKKLVKRKSTVTAGINPDCFTSSPSLNMSEEQIPPMGEVQRRIAALKLRSAAARAAPNNFSTIQMNPSTFPRRLRKGKPSDEAGAEGVEGPR